MSKIFFTSSYFSIFLGTIVCMHESKRTQNLQKNTAYKSATRILVWSNIHWSPNIITISYSRTNCLFNKSYEDLCRTCFLQKLCSKHSNWKNQFGTEQENVQNSKLTRPIVFKTIMNNVLPERVNASLIKFQSIN